MFACSCFLLKYDGMLWCCCFSYWLINPFFSLLNICLTLLGDLGGSSARDEVGGDIETKHHAASPNSPSTSGGFRQFSSKGLCIEDMSARHYFGGCMELYVQDIVMLFGPRVCFWNVGWLWYWEISTDQNRSGPATVLI